jgi:LysM repeat protein
MLFELELDDYKGWAKGLKKCGYATNPEYAERLITIIERHNLNVLDVEGNDALAEVGKGETKVETEIVKEQQVISDRLGSESKARTSRNAPTNDGGARRIRTTEHGIQFVFAREGDTQKSLGKELDMMPWQFRKYNGVSKSHVFNLGDKIYLQPKKNHAAYTWHTVRLGQTIWDISQIYGIKTSAIIRKNRLNPNESLQAGTKLSLQWPLSKEGELPWYAKLITAKES